MRIEILHIDECPNWVEAAARVDAALAEIGGEGAVVTHRLLTSSDDAAQVAFAGSPTILLDGVDAFATDGQTSDLACRIYRTDSGFAGVPTVAQLVEAMRGHVKASDAVQDPDATRSWPRAAWCGQPWVIWC